MQIIYGYSNCSDKKYKEIFSSGSMVAQACQKYHSLLIKGLATIGVKVYCFSGLPINRSITSKVWIHEKDEREDDVYFHYYRTINIPIFRHLMIFIGALFNGLKISKREQTVAICDCLNIANSYGISLACKLRRIPVIIVVTDLPDMLGENKLLAGINNKLFNMADGFVFLTEQMNEKINRRNVPYIVLEGHVDSELPPINSNEKYEQLSGKKVIIYAGSIQKLYGIPNLVEGFLKANIPDAELRVFGNGDYRDELVEIAKNNENVKYMGICDNKEVVSQEQRAMLLVNPRPTHPEYTKYSFPSKNMEYMVSGTPLLTTKLPGMPKEYYPYIYLAKDETVEGLCETLTNICGKELEERNAMGNKARMFVMEHKTNVKQAKKLICFIKQEIK